MFQLVEKVPECIFWHDLAISRNIKDATYFQAENINFAILYIELVKYY